MGQLSLRNVFVRGSTSSSRVISSPTADFTASVVAGLSPLTVTFTDTSTNNPTSWAWDFTNDGVTDSTSQNPTYTFSTAGTYSVKLTATNASGSGITIKTGLITVSSSNIGSAYFDGSGDYLSIPANAAFQFGTGAYTVEFWVYPQTLSTIHVYVRNNTTGGWQVYWDTTSGLSLSAVGSSPFLTAGTSVFTVNQWSHVLVSRNSTSANDTRIFVNGIVRATGTDTTNWTANGALTIGADSSGTYPFAGYISNARIVKGTAVYTSSFVPPSSPLTVVSGTSLLTCTSGSIKDDSANNFTITKVGNTVYSDDSPYNLSGWSTYFDGTGDYLTLPSSSTYALGTGDFTIEGWVNYDRVVNSGIFQIAASYFGGTSGIGLGLDSQAVPKWLLYYGNGSQTAATISPVVGQWTHFLVMRSSGSTKLFINGMLTISVADTANYTGTFLGIGGIYSTAYLIKGYISNFRIVKGLVYDPMAPQFKVSTAPLTNVPGTVLLACNSASQVDASPTRATITANGNAAVKANSPFTTYNATVNSLVDGSTYFDGAGDYLTVANNAALNISGGDFTLEAWVYITALPALNGDNKRICAIMSYGTTTLNQGYQFIISFTDNNLWLNSPGTGNGAVGSFTFAFNTWYHVAATRSGSTDRLFVNGNSLTLTTNTFNNISSPSGTLKIGAERTFTNFNLDFPGYISNLRIVKGTALYTSNFTPSTSPLTAVSGTSLLTCQSRPIKDASTNNFAVTAYADAKYSVMGPLRNISSGSSVYFDGTGDYLTVPYNTNLNILTGDFTVESWIYHTVVGYDVIAGSWGQSSSPARDGWVLEVNGNNGLGFSWAGFSVFANLLTSANNIVSLNTWHHVAVTRSGNTFTLYLNGTSVATGTSSGVSNAVYQIDIGFYGNGSLGSSPTSYWNGYISNLRIVKGTAVYTSNFTPSTSPLTAVSGTALLTCQSSAIIDNSTNAFAITRNGDARIINAGPFVSSASDSYTFADPTFGSSVYFDGTGDYLRSTSNVAITTGLFTVEFWVYSTTSSGGRMIIDNGYWQIGNNGGYRVALNTNNTLSLSASNGVWNTFPTIITSTSTVPTATWSHVAITRNSSNQINIYINGVVAATPVTYSASLNLGAGQTLKIGGNIADGTLGNTFTGYLSNIRVVNGTAVYTANFTAPTSQLTAITGTALLTCQNGNILDASTNAITLTPNGNASASALGPFSANVVSA